MLCQSIFGTSRILEFGFRFLHEVCQPPVVHQNFKSSKVLLDGKLSVRVADSGLAYMLPPRPTSQVNFCMLSYS